jgi:hypothetical protein
VPSTSTVVPAFRLNPAIAAIFAGVPVVPAEAEGKAAWQPATQMMGKARHHSKHVRVGQGEASEVAHVPVRRNGRPLSRET